MIKSNCRTYCVYIHINTINGKRYIGITSKTPEERWGRCGYGYYNNKHFMSAIKKYGWDNFKHNIVAFDLDVGEASKLERELINKYNSNNPLFGYNICNGGETNILPQSSLDKISQKNKGRKITNEMKQKRINNPPNAIKVVCNNIEFRSISECARYYCISPKNMESWFSGIGYIPKRFVEYNLRPVDYEVEYVQCYSKRKWVVCDDKEYESVCDFCKSENLSPDTVRGWLYGKYRMPEQYVRRGLRRFHKEFYKMIIKEK